MYCAIKMWAKSYFEVFNSVGSFLGMIPGIVILRMFYFTFNLLGKANLGSA